MSKIAFPENKDDDNLFDEEAREENFINDTTTTEPLNLKVETITKRGNAENIIQHNTESSITSMGNVFFTYLLEKLQAYWLLKYLG